MKALALPALIAAAVATGALAQTPDPHAGHDMGAMQPDPHAGQGEAPADQRAGHAAPPQPADPHAQHATPAPATDPHALHAAPGPAEPHAGHGVPQAPEPAASAPPPPPPTDHAADAIYDAAAMERARAILREEHGGAPASKVMSNILEYQSREGGGYRWDVEGRFGGDINRLVVKTEGEGGGRHGLETAEVQVLYSRAVGRYTDLQLGIRHEFEPGPSRTQLVAGLESLLPYWFEAEGAVFLSEKGDLTARLEGTYDFRLTQRLILQPQVELAFSAQDIPELGIRSGFTHGELGLRLRYEIRREFGPYVGVAYERSLGGTADVARSAGEDIDSTRFVIGIRTWL